MELTWVPHPTPLSIFPLLAPSLSLSSALNTLAQGAGVVAVKEFTSALNTLAQGTKVVVVNEFTVFFLYVFLEFFSFFLAVHVVGP